MRVGLALPHYDFSIPGRSGADPAVTVEWARKAEALGYNSVWVSDHYFIDLKRYGGPPGRQGSVEPLTTLAAIAAATERVRIGTLVLCEAFRPPAQLAKEAATLDRLSNGRLEIGMGAGWNDEEFVAAGHQFGSPGERMDRLDEAVRIVAGLLAEPSFTFEGRWYRVASAAIVPPSVQHPRPSVFVGSKGGSRSLRIVAEAADGWNTVWRWPVNEYSKAANALDDACIRAGRDPKTVSRSLGLYTIVGTNAEAERAWKALKRWMPGVMAGTTPSEFANGTLVGTAEQCAERCAAYAALGVEELIVSPGPLPFAIPLPEQVDAIAEQLIPLIRDV